MHYIVLWANNEAATTEIIPTTHQKKWRYIVYRLNAQYLPINLHKIV